MAGIRQLGPLDVSKALAKGTCDLIDVREATEFAESRIPGAKLAPLSAFDPAAIPQAPGRLAVVTCAAGGRSMKAAELCAQAGLSVFNLTGGLAAWTKAGLPVERG